MRLEREKKEGLPTQPSNDFILFIKVRGAQMCISTKAVTLYKLCTKSGLSQPRKFHSLCSQLGSYHMVALPLFPRLKAQSFYIKIK